ncbi:MAG TPA: DNA repair protein RecN [Steroidobacteraceae bacterium]|nr:DNA repair protein RecN [Steroidobacteraceae bacterium]
MLTYLHILDFAIIDALELDVRSGLTVLTGETGAGKSILVDALQLIAGGRAGAEVVRHGAQRAEVTATFELAQAPRELKSWLEDQSIDVEQELSVRRVVTTDGRSRAYLNGQSVTVQQLRDAGNILLDIHGQHEFQTLTRSSGQRDLLDSFGRHEAAAAEVEIAQRVWLKLLNAALELETKARDRDARLSLLRYQAQELSALALTEGEFAALTEEANRMANRGRITESVQGALGQLYEEDAGSAHAAVARALQQLKTVAALDPGIATVLTLVDSAAIQIREAARELQHYLDSQDFDAARQDQVQRRLAAIEELARKNRIAPAQLHERAAALATELAQLESAESDLATVRADLAMSVERYREQAKLLSARRATAARALSKTVTNHMQQLGMTGGRFQIDVTPLESPEPQPHGVDQIEFRVTANPGQPLRALSKVASGGELARLSLAVQVACAGRDSRCMVFDEVDSGIGGAVAEIVGRELRSLAERAQVLCVTHLPQVASQADHHLRVNKLTDGKTTRTSLSDLGGPERVEELARMLGGVEITIKAREHAQDMLRQVQVRSSGDARRSDGRSGRK